MAKIKISKEKLLEEIKHSTVTALAKQYGVSWITMRKYLTDAGYKEGVNGRPNSFEFEEE